MRLRTAILAALTTVLVTLTLASTPTAQAAGPGQISGVVTDTSGRPLNTCVYVYDVTYLYAGSACTDEFGAYVVSGLSDGTAYRVDVAGDGVHAEKWFASGNNISEATNVVAPGTADVRLPLMSTLTGLLTDQTGAPVSAAAVTAYDATQSYVSGSTTAANGSWSLRVPPGPYKIEFTKGSIDMWYRQAFSFASADAVTVAEAATATANAQLAGRGAVTGTVTDAVTGARLANICVQVVDRATFETTGTNVGSACTDDTGVYRAPVLTPGTYTVQFIDGYSRYIGVYAGGTRTIASAQTVTVGLAGDVRRDQTLQLGGVITGRAVDARTLQPVAGISAALAAGPVDPVTGVFPPVWGSGSTFSDDQGSYTVSAIPSGSYTMQLNPGVGTGYAQQWYNGVTTQALALPIAVTAPLTTSLLPSLFVPAGTPLANPQTTAHLTGSVVNADGSTPAANLHLAAFVYSTTGAYISRFDVSRTSGWRIPSSALPPGTYVIKADVVNQTTKAVTRSGWYDRKSKQTAGTVVSLTKGATKAITLHLP